MYHYLVWKDKVTFVNDFKHRIDTLGIRLDQLYLAMVTYGYVDEVPTGTCFEYTVELPDAFTTIVATSPKDIDGDITNVRTLKTVKPEDIFNPDFVSYVMTICSKY